MVKFAVSSFDIPQTFFFATGGKLSSNIWNPAKAPSANSTLVSENIIFIFNTEYCQTILHFGKRVGEVDLPSRPLFRGVFDFGYFNLRHEKTFIRLVGKGRIDLDNTFPTRTETVPLGTASVRQPDDRT